MALHPETIEVPRRLIAELATYLDQAGAPAVSVPDNGSWTEAMVGQLRQEVTAYPGALAALNLAARRAGNTVTLDDIERECGLTRKQISSDLGAMSKAARRLWGRKVWPMRAMQTNAGMNYLMPPEIADWWLR